MKDDDNDDDGEIEGGTFFFGNISSFVGKNPTLDLLFTFPPLCTYIFFAADMLFSPHFSFMRFAHVAFFFC